MSIKGDPYTNTRAGVPVNSATVQTGIGLGRETVQRLDRLRAVYGKSRSYVADLALTSGGLSGLEAVNAADVARFGDLAADAGMTWQEYVEAYVTDFGTKTYPPTVAQLEEKKWRRTIPARRLPKLIREAVQDFHETEMEEFAEKFSARREEVAAAAPMWSGQDEPAADMEVRTERPPRGLRDVLG
jgi:predicted transcriptional regulator